MLDDSRAKKARQHVQKVIPALDGEVIGEILCAYAKCNKSVVLKSCNMYDMIKEDADAGIFA